MTAHYHAVIWIDHHEARVFHFNADQADEAVVHAAHSSTHLHSKAGSVSGTHVTDEPQFYGNVAKSVPESQKILIVGPSSAKTEFVKYLEKHAPQTHVRVAGVETMDRLTDNQILTEGRRYFAQEDRMERRRAEHDRRASGKVLVAQRPAMARDLLVLLGGENLHRTAR